MHCRMDAATSWLVRRKDAVLRETGTLKAAQVTFFTPYGWTRLMVGLAPGVAKVCQPDLARSRSSASISTTSTRRFA